MMMMMMMMMTTIKSSNTVILIIIIVINVQNMVSFHSSENCQPVAVSMQGSIECKVACVCVCFCFGNFEVRNVPKSCMCPICSVGFWLE